MAKNVRFIQTTKEKYLARGTYDETALYFCIDTNEMFKGSAVYTDGIRVIEKRSDLPECSCAADGVVYYVHETRNGYIISPDRTEWLQTIYAPVKDVTKIPESEIYNTVTTVGAVRDIESALYAYVNNKIENSDDIGGKFDDVQTSISCGGIEAGTSLYGKTIKDVLIMLLGIKEAPKHPVVHIRENQIPCYSGLDGEESVEVVYKQLDGATASYTDQGFYVITDDKGNETEVGYQIVFEANTEGIAQAFEIYSEAKIVAAYQYQPALNQWLDMGFDGTYWVEAGTDTKIVNGEEVTYTTYAYNIELMGDPITATEYWRFELEAL